MVIEVKNLKKSFGEKQVLYGFNCTFPTGEITCLMGTSGCGKTTLLHIMMGLLSFEEGQILGLSGKRLSAVFQENRLCESISASANIRLVNPALTRPQVCAMLQAVGLPPESEERVQDYSGGMKRRVAILRALHADYDVLLLDEPFRGLDPETKEIVMQYFLEQTAGKTVILVTHEPEEPAFLHAAQVIEMQGREELHLAGEHEAKE